MIEVNEILQTMQMIHEQHFDIRTITMGISLLSCKKNHFEILTPPED